MRGVIISLVLHAVFKGLTESFLKIVNDTLCLTVEQWQENPDGTIADVAWSIALPELDGVIEPMFIGAQERQGEAERRVPVESRVRKLVRRLAKWVNLKK